jgi:hypothetical protein
VQLLKAAGAVAAGGGDDDDDNADAMVEDADADDADAHKSEDPVPVGQEMYGMRVLVVGTKKDLGEHTCRGCCGVMTTRTRTHTQGAR